MFTSIICIIGIFFSVPFLYAQPPGAVPARPNIMYYAGGACEFYDASNVKLLSVNQAEAVWSVSPAKSAWVVVTPANGGYYEFPNYSNSLIPTYDQRQYLLPFWKSDTIIDELVLLDNVGAEATLMYTPKSVLSVKNYDGTISFEINKDYTIQQRTIKQVSAEISKSVSIVPGKTGNGNSNGLINTRHTSWTRVSYIADRTKDHIDIDIQNKKELLPKTFSKLLGGQSLTVQAVGMSITAGLNVSGFIGDDKNFPPTKPYMRGYLELFTEQLREQYGSNVTSINSACGGKTAGWLATYAGALVNRNTPDLVIIDMGMNDIWGITSQAQFKASIESTINTIRKDVPNAEFILIGNMVPDVKGVGAPANGAALMFGFLEMLKSLEGPGIAVLDMTTLSETIFQRKGAKHCIANSLHPNDYLARWYAQGLMALFGDGRSVPKTPRTFYVNSNGDNTDGSSKEKAWTSLDKINDMTFNPGDSILFEGG
ncbi:MAG: SGNH/GDSL hydrolase family protein, partial [Ignavibacteria bacterium]